MKIKIITSIFFLIFLGISSVQSKEEFSNYKKYGVTKTKFKLEVVAKKLGHPWALTFIDNKYLIVTERSGGIYKINIKTGKKQEIKHYIQHINHDSGSQGGLLDSYFNKTDGFIC